MVAQTIALSQPDILPAEGVCQIKADSEIDSALEASTSHSWNEGLEGRGRSK